VDWLCSELVTFRLRVPLPATISMPARASSVQNPFGPDGVCTDLSCSTATAIPAGSHDRDASSGGCPKRSAAQNNHAKSPTTYVLTAFEWESTSTTREFQ
jgi:hypothetical protein